MTYNPISTIHITSLNLVKSCVRPIELPSKMINRQTVWRKNIFGDDVLTFKSLEIGALYPRLFVVPVRPE